MRMIGIDPGARRMGVAVCDAEEMIASPVRIVSLPPGGSSVDAIIDLVREFSADRVVIGHPRMMNGRSGDEACKAEALCASLQENGIDAVLWDERLTSAEASRTLREEGKQSRKQQRQVLDAVAAQRILASYLDWRSKRRPLSDAP